MSGRVEFSFTHTEELPAGGRLAAELHKALRARDEQALTLTLTPARTLTLPKPQPEPEP